jgi:hypothetical protein
VIPVSNLGSKASSQADFILAAFSLSWQNSGLYVSLGHTRVCPSPFHSINEGRSESKERFAIQRDLLIIGKKQNMQVLSHTFTYFST